MSKHSDSEDALPNAFPKGGLATTSQAGSSIAHRFMCERVAQASLWLSEHVFAYMLRHRLLTIWARKAEAVLSGCNDCPAAAVGPSRPKRGARQVRTVKVLRQHAKRWPPFFRNPHPARGGRLAGVR